MSRCECTWKAHDGQLCRNEAADHGDVRTSPELCMPCLFVCCGERDEADDELQQIASNACHHCGRMPEPEYDGDHSCTCPYTDEECPDHAPRTALLGRPEEGQP